MWKEIYQDIHILSMGNGGAHSLLEPFLGGVAEEA
jgi:hypothetical protein